MAFAQTVKKVAQKSQDFLGLSSNSEEYYDDSYQTFADQTQIRANTSVKPVHGSATNSIVTLYPANYEEAPYIASALNEGHITTLNLSKLSKDETRLIVAYSAGVIDGIGGNIERIHEHIFILTPPNVAIVESME